MKRELILLALIVLISIAGCQKSSSTGQNKSSSTTSSGTTETSTTATTTAFNPNANLDTANTFFDDFNNGININTWQIANEKWGTGNNGVVYQNVNYTSDGILVLQANGAYYAGKNPGFDSTNGTLTGAAIISNKSFGPGQFSVKMKVMPRFGSTTAFWTYYNNGTANDEIDMEMNVDSTFKDAWFTNWLTVNDSDHYVAHTNTVLNDGQWHIFQFDWQTDPARIDYYIDGKLLHTSYTDIPTMAMRIWLGNWFPQSWAGTPDFEQDYTFVDWVKYVPYLNEPYTPTPGGQSYAANEYPTAPIPLPVNNLVSNAGFEGDPDAWSKSLTSQSQIVPNQGIDNSKAMNVPAKDEVYQTISGIDDSFDMTFVANAKFDQATSDGGQVLIQYMPLDSSVIGSQVITFSPSDSGFVNNQYYQKTLHLTLPAGTQRIKICLLGGTTGSIDFDNLFLNLTSKMPTGN